MAPHNGKPSGETGDEFGKHSLGTYLTAVEVEDAGGMVLTVTRIGVSDFAKTGKKDIVFGLVGGHERGLVMNRTRYGVLLDWLNGRGAPALVGASLNLSTEPTKMGPSIVITSVRKTTQGKVA